MSSLSESLVGTYTCLNLNTKTTHHDSSRSTLLGWFDMEV